MNVDVDRGGWTALHHAAFTNQPDEIERLVREGADLNLGDFLGFTPLHLAAQEFAVAAGEMLLQLGASVDPANSFGNTPLLTAVTNSTGRGEFIRLLRSHGADPLRPSRSGVSPYDYAQMVDNYDLKRFFADVTPPPDGMSPR